MLKLLNINDGNVNLVASIKKTTFKPLNFTSPHLKFLIEYKLSN